MSVLLSSFEIAEKKVLPAKNFIPRITDPMGKHWHQPSTHGILIDDQNVLMDRKTFEGLAEYSCTNPSGVYPGKMWKCKKDYYDESKGWLLKWFGIHPTDPEKFVSNHQRTILLV